MVVNKLKSESHELKSNIQIRRQKNEVKKEAWTIFYWMDSMCEE